MWPIHQTPGDHNVPRDDDDDDDDGDDDDLTHWHFNIVRPTYTQNAHS